MQLLAKRRLSAVFTEKKIKIVVKIFRLARARTDDEDRPAHARRQLRQQPGARAALKALNSLAAGPGAFEKMFQSLRERDIGHEKKLKRCSWIFGSGGIVGGSAGFSAASAHLSTAWQSSFKRICKKAG